MQGRKRKLIQYSDEELTGPWYELTEKFDVCGLTIRSEQQRRGILVVNKPRASAKLNECSDEELMKHSLRELSNRFGICPKTVLRERVKRGLSEGSKKRKEIAKKNKKVNWKEITDEELLSNIPCRVARKLGCHRESVHYQLRKRKIGK